MNLQNIDKMLQAEFMSKKIKAEMKAEQMRAYLAKVPTYAKIIAVEKQLVFDIAKLQANGEKNKELKEQLKILRNEKNKIFKALKITEADLSPKYTCLKCGDSGFVGTEMCECYKKRRNEEIIKASGLESSLDCSFENFSTKICSNEKQAKNQEKLKEKLEKWCNDHPNTKKKNIVISGKVGVGKTFFAKCVANKMLGRGLSVCFVSAFDMNNMLLKYHTTFNAEKQNYIIPLIESDILIIDDLGTEPKMKNVTENYLFLVLSERERFSRPIVVTTNLTSDDILEKYGERIYSRLFSKLTGASLYIDGEDLRLTK